MAPVTILRRDPGHRSRNTAPRPNPVSAPAARVPRMRVLSVLSSATPLDSGLGRARLELAARLASRTRTTIAIDDTHPDRVDAAIEFGRDHDIPVLVGPGVPSSDAPDAFLADLASLLRRDEWDLVETAGSENVATHGLLLRVLGERALVFTPGLTPGWNDGWAPTVAHRALDVHRDMVRRADAVLALSPWEVPVIQHDAPGRNHTHLVPLGHGFAPTAPALTRRAFQLVFAGDPTDHRDRFDLALAVLATLLDRWPTLELVVPCPAKAKDRVAGLIPAPLRSACEIRADSDLHEILPGVRGALRFGPTARGGGVILDALGAGTPVFLAEGDPVRSLYHGQAGVGFCPADAGEAAHVVASSLARGDEAIRATLANRERLRAAFDWDALAVRQWDVFASAWFTRHYIDHPFRGPVATTARAARTTA